MQKERKKTEKPREGWEDGTPPPHRDFKERGVVRLNRACARVHRLILLAVGGQSTGIFEQ